MYRTHSKCKKLGLFYTFCTSCWGEDDKTVERSSILLRATFNASAVSSAEKLCTGISRCARLASNSASDTERGGVKIDAKLSSSCPGKRISLDLKLF